MHVKEVNMESGVYLNVLALCLGKKHTAVFDQEKKKDLTSTSKAQLFCLDVEKVNPWYKTASQNSLLAVHTGLESCRCRSALQ